MLREIFKKLPSQQSAGPIAGGTSVLSFPHLSFRVLSLCLLVLFTGSCTDDAIRATQKAKSEQFVQHLFPEHLDVLWVVDDRSPMGREPFKSHLLNEVALFFQRLDVTNHRMGVVSADMQFAKGALRPKDNPVILTSGFGTPEQRTQNFLAVFADGDFNLRTGHLDKGFEAAETALRESFQPREGIPLVMVFISNADDVSPSPGGADAVDHYRQTFLELKNDNDNLLRVYSINYTLRGERCVPRDNADIDNSPNFEDRYFRLARALNGDTADICSPWAEDIDLTGLKLGQPRSRFPLQQSPRENSVQVTITLDGLPVPPIGFTIDTLSNEIIFDEPPPEGSLIEINYFFT